MPRTPKTKSKGPHTRTEDALCVEPLDGLKERQENEFALLQSVYDRELRDLRKPAPWQVWCPLDMVLTLGPQQSASGAAEIHAQIDLHIKCSNGYPDEIPELLLENARGLSKRDMDELLVELSQLAQKLRGEVMILELAQRVHTYLHVHNKPGPGSFYEEMLSNRRRQEKAREEEIRRREAKEREDLKEEIQRRQEEIREEERLWREQAKQTGASSRFSSILSATVTSSNHLARSLSPPVSPIMTNGGREFSPVTVGLGRRGLMKSDSQSSQESPACACGHYGVSQITFSCRNMSRVIQRGKCLGHSLRGSVTYAGMDVMTGELVVINEWTLKPRSGDSFQEEGINCQKQLATVEQEMSSLSKMQHRHLVHYLGMSCSSSDVGLTVVQVLQEFVPGGHLDHHLTENIPVDYDLLQYYASGILEALSFLHRNSVVHKDLRPTSIFVENTGLVRVADYSLDKRLFEIYSSLCKTTTEGMFPPSLGRGGKRADIFRFGVLCLSLARGDVVNSLTPEVPSSLPTALRHFLEMCLIRNEQERWSAEQLLDHEFLKPSVSREPKLRANELVAEEPKSEEPGTLPNEVPEIPAEPSGSRLLKEFDVLSWLGRGGFGDVYKVRNKLDGGVYAIKRIPLNPSNKQLNRKITREVKLLSRLNHENVVRYFNSWMETAWVDRRALDENDAESDETDGGMRSVVRDVFRKDLTSAAGASQSMDTSCNHPKNDSSVEWSVSFEFSKRPLLDDDGSDDDDDDDDDDEDEEDVFGSSFLSKLDASDEIVFEGEADSDAALSSSEKTDVVDSGGDDSTMDREKSNRRVVQFVYIQMELCDRSTLRDAIDGGLHANESRLWRLFREVVEGLAHIHQQGMIHRDLKPVNIFLDSGDHVKIGDFGLATTNVLTRADGPVSSAAVALLLPGGGLDSGVSQSESASMGDNHLTTWVGTFLYVSPEVADQSSRSPYNQKVDVYSLGIILFEMCYQPLITAMERVKVLDNLRRPEISFPPEFNETTKPREMALIRWMLDHDPVRRPTTQELLQSRHLPPPQLEEAEMRDLFFHTISNPQSKIYKHLISSLLEQRMSTAAQVTYDMDIHRGTFNLRFALAHRFLARKLVRIFEKHGALPVSTPLLTPKSDEQKGRSDEVEVVDHGGGVVTLPYDLRVPFCRFLVKNRVTSLKRYHISPVFRERKVYGTHPRALLEGTFDIVTPAPASLLVDAEVLQVVWELFCELPPLRGRTHLLRLNHSALLKGILTYCGVPEDKHADVCSAISRVKMENVGRSELQMRLTRLGVADYSAQTMQNLLETEWPIGRLGGLARSLQAKRSRAGSGAAALVERGIAELETIADNLNALGVTGGVLAPTIVVVPGLVYGARHFSGLVFQFACNLKMKKRKKLSTGLDILAAGGRYDRLVAQMRSTMDLTGSSPDYCQAAAVGVSIAVEKLVSAIVECEDFEVPGAYDVLVCSVGRQVLTKQIGRVASDLRQAGISVHTHYECADSLDAVHELCRELNVSRVVVLKDNDPHSIKLHVLDKDRFTETSVPTSNVLEVLQKELLESGGTSSSQTVGYFSPRTGDSSHCRADRSISESSSTGYSVSTNPQLNITFATLEKLAANTRRRHEAQILSQLSTTMQLFSAKVGVEVVAVDLKADVLATISCHFQALGSEKEFELCIAAVIEKYPRHKKSLTKLADQVNEFLFEKRRSVVILYGLPDGAHRVLV